MKTIAPGRKRLLNNVITYGMVIAAFVILQVLNAGGMLSPSLQGQLVPICAYVTMATQILEFSQTPQQAQLEEFYSDVEYPPAEEGQGVTLAAKELDSASISALQQAGLYEEGKHYWFVYLVSQNG